MLERKNNRQRQLRFHRVNFLTFTAGYARKEVQVNADMRLVLVTTLVVYLTACLPGNRGDNYIRLFHYFRVKPELVKHRK